MIRFLMTPGLISATPAARESAAPQEVLSGSTIFALHQRAAASAIAPEQLVAQPTVYSGISMHKPLLLIYGEQDALVQPGTSAARAKELYPRTAVELYARSGHSPFFEESARFNRDLSAFADAASAH